MKTSFCFWTIFGIASVALFWPGLAGGQVPGFRDAFHFYYPQAVWLDQCAERGEYFPQWHAGQALGVSLPGETTSALYYPLRAIWFLPWLSVAQRYAVFVLTHLFLAALGMRYACQRWSLRKEAGWLAGASFALSCPLLFQHTNLIFLCSAAWLGFVFAELGCWLTRQETDGCQPRLATLAGAIAMMVLAGDPHSAVNVVVLALFLAAVSGIAKRSWPWFAKSTCWLAAAVVLAVGLSAIQSLPSSLWARQSHRWLNEVSAAASAAEHDGAANRGAPNSAGPGAASGEGKSQPPARLAEILAQPSAKSSRSIYEFSLSPWHLLTSIWPTLGGNFAPENSRVFAYISAEGRMWIPSLFFGLVPLLLVLGGFGKLRGARYRWLLFAAVFALLASLGNYSPGWLARQLLVGCGAADLANQLPPDHSTSLYGLLADWLPGYGVFRYPAKWSVICIACWVLLAAVRFDRLSESELLRASWVQRVVLCLSGCGLIATLALAVAALFDNPLGNSLGGGLGSFLEGLRPTILPDAWLGLPRDAAIFWQLVSAFSAPLTVLSLLYGLRWRSARPAHRSPYSPLPMHALCAWIGLLEVSLVATSWCSFVAAGEVKPAGPWTPQIVWADAREADIQGDGWLEDSSLHPAMAIAEYQRAFALGKLALLSNRHNLAASLSIEPELLKRLRTGLGRLDDLSSDQPELDKLLAWLGVEQRLVRTRTVGKRARFEWQPIPGPHPLCELQLDDELLPKTAAVRWQWVRAGALDVEIVNPTSGQLLVRQFNDGGWQVVSAQTSFKPSPVGRDASGLFVEVAVAAGASRFTLERTRWPLRLGLAISGLSTLAALGLSLAQSRLSLRESSVKSS